MNLFTFKSIVDIDGKMTTVLLLHTIYLEHLDDHAKDLSRMIPNKSFYFECLGKLTHAFLNGLSCLVFTEDTLKELCVIESIHVSRLGNGLVVKSEASQSLWTFGSKLDLDNWEAQLLLVEQSLHKPIILPKFVNKLYNSPPITPTRDITDRLSVPSHSPPKFGSTSFRNNRSWLSFHKPKKPSKEKVGSRKQVKSEHKSEDKEEQRPMFKVQRKKVIEEEPVGIAKEESDGELYVFDTDDEVEILVTKDNLDALRLSTDGRLSLDFEDQADIFSDFKRILK
jgi:hypothetical protein